jgi:ubiquinol-cytochrome c reductase cytochrome c subunit
VSDDFDVEAELGFEPAVSAAGASVDDRLARKRSQDPTQEPAQELAHDLANGEPREPRLRGGLRRRLAAATVLLVALIAMGGTYAAFATSSGADDTTSSASDIKAGRQLYEVSCITCHGANLEGIKGQGPPLLGVGAAAVYFQVSTGRMPATGQGAYEGRKVAKFDEKQTDQIAAYVESVGGGPTIPQGSLRGDSSTIGEGGELFRLNCASCHGTTFKGAPLSAGKIAPSLNEATDKQIFAAMLSGPESMPVFSNNELTLDQKKAIVAYIQTIKASADPGGNGIDRIGPVSEAVVIWVVGVGVIMVAILWIGAKAQ